MWVAAQDLLRSAAEHAHSYRHHSTGHILSLSAHDVVVYGAVRRQGCLAPMPDTASREEDAPRDQY